jgi:hypothetical protein
MSKRRDMKRVYLLAITASLALAPILLLLMFPAAESVAFTWERFAQLRPGMTRVEVEQLLGPSIRAVRRPDGNGTIEDYRDSRFDILSFIPGCTVAYVNYDDQGTVVSTTARRLPSKRTIIHNGLVTGSP